MTSILFSVRTILAAAVCALLFAAASLALANGTGTPYIALVVIDKDGNSADSAEILEGEEVTLAWSGQNVTECVISPGNIAADDMGPSSTHYDGQIVLTPTSNDMEYNITCQGASDSVSMIPAPTVTVSVDNPFLALTGDGSLIPDYPIITWDAASVRSCGSIVRFSPASPLGAPWEKSVSDIFSGSLTDDSITAVGEYRYELTCNAFDGRPVSAGVTVEVTGTAQVSELTLTASSDPVISDAEGVGTITLEWSGVNLTRCKNIVHITPIVRPGPKFIGTDTQNRPNTYGSTPVHLVQPGEHVFRLACIRGDGLGEIESVETVVLVLGGVNETVLNVTADPTAITLTATGGPQRTAVLWKGSPLSHCADHMLRKAPNETEFSRFPYSATGALTRHVNFDRAIFETGVYTYKLTCYSSIDGSEVTDTAVVIVDGDDLVPELNIVASPDRVTPDPSTGLGSTSITWSHPNYPNLFCSPIGVRTPGTARNYTIVDDYLTRQSGIELVDDLNRYGVWGFALRCRHPLTFDWQRKDAYVTVDPVDLLDSNMSLVATQVDDKIEVEYSSEHYSSCSSLEKQAPGSPTWYTFDTLSANTSGTIIDSSTLARGEYSYRLTCSRPIDDTVDTVKTTVDYTEGTVTDSAVIGFGECRDSSGDVIDIPVGYEVDTSSGDCVLIVPVDTCQDASGNAIPIPVGHIKDIAGNCAPISIGTPGNINLSFESPLIRAGDTAQINWEYTGTYVFDSCFLQGPGLVDPNTGDSTMNLPVNVEAGVIGNARTDPRYATSMYSLTCTNPFTIVPLTSDQIRLEVVPTYQEV